MAARCWTPAWSDTGAASERPRSGARESAIQTGLTAASGSARRSRRCRRVTSAGAGATSGPGRRAPASGCLNGSGCRRSHAARRATGPAGTALQSLAGFAGPPGAAAPVSRAHAPGRHRRSCAQCPQSRRAIRPRWPAAGGASRPGQWQHLRQSKPSVRAPSGCALLRCPCRPMRPSASRCRAAQTVWPAAAAPGPALDPAGLRRPDRPRSCSGCRAPCGQRSGAKTRPAPARATASRACVPTPSSGSAPSLRRRRAQIPGSDPACGGPLRSRPVLLPPRAPAVAPARSRRHNVPDGRGTCALRSRRAAGVRA